MNNVRRPQPFITPLTGARRIPLLGFHGFWLRGEFGAAQAGLHHSPALSCCANRVLLLVEAIRLLELRFRHRLLVFGRRALPGNLGQKSNKPLCRTEQGVPGKDDK